LSTNRFWFLCYWFCISAHVVVVSVGYWKRSHWTHQNHQNHTPSSNPVSHTTETHDFQNKNTTETQALAGGSRAPPPATGGGFRAIPLNHMGIQSLIIVLVRKVFHFHDGHRHWMSYEYIFLIWFPDEISMELSNCLENFRFLWIV
jgi:hypothetical protein